MRIYFTTKRLAAVSLVAALLSGCTNMEDSPKQTVGTILGTGVGALIGAQMGGGKGKLAAVAIGALGGAYLGSELGKSLDNADKAIARDTTQETLEKAPTGHVSTWSNPDSGHSGSIKPISTYQSASNTPCREFESTIYVDGQQETGVGKACRQEDGTWKIVQ